MKQMILLVVLLSGCDRPETTPMNRICDKSIQERVFLGCLDRARHPELAAVAANDAAEIVSECESAAEGIACRYVLGGIQQ